MLRRSTRGRGYTLIEVLLVVVAIGLATSMGVGIVRNSLRKAKLQGVAREAMISLRAARFKAVKEGVPAGLRLDFSTSTDPARFYAFIDDDLDGLYTPPANPEPGDRIFAMHVLPQGVVEGGPDTGSGDDQLSVFGFATDTDGGWTLFDSDGAARFTGAFRVGDGYGNHLEVRVPIAATGQVAMRKWIRQGSGGSWKANEQTGGWEWY